MNAEELRNLLLGANLELMDDDIVERFYFVSSNHVSAALGTRPGALRGPVLKYLVAEDCKVELTGPSFHWIWESITVQDDILETRCGDVQKRFKIIPGLKEPLTNTQELIE